MTTRDGLADAGPARFADWRVAGESRGYLFHDRMVAPKLRGLLFSDGSGVVAENVVDALASSTPFIAGRVSATYTAAKVPVSSLFIAIPLARSMPSVLLVNARSGALRDAGMSIGTRQLLSLEGDFDRSYSLYCPIGDSALALGMFTPQLMRLVLKHGSDSDIEIVDDWMFVYGTASRSTSGDMLDAIENLTRSVNGAIVGPPVESIEGEPGETRSSLKRPSGRALVVVSLIAIALGGIATIWGSLVY